MIKNNKGELDIEGKAFDLIMEFSQIVHVLGPEENVISKELMYKIVDSAFMSKDELRSESLKALEKIKKNMERFLDKACEHRELKDECDQSKSKDSSSKSTDVFNDMFKDLLGE